MLLGFVDKLMYLKQTHEQVQNGVITFDPCKPKFGFRNMEQLCPFRMDEIKGFPCVVYNRMSDPVKIAVKVVPLEKKYDQESHPYKIELGLLKEFSKLVVDNVSPHLTWFFGDLDIPNNKKCMTLFPLKYFQPYINKHCNVLFTEYVPGGSIEEWAQDTTGTVAQWKYIIFSIVWTLVVLQDKYKFTHCDLHYGNVLIDSSINPKDKTVLSYTLKTKDGKKEFVVKNCGIIPKIWDLEFSMVETQVSVPHNPFGRYGNNVPHKFNPYYDLHQFLISLLELDIPECIEDFILSVYPEQVIPEMYSSSDSDSCSSELSMVSDMSSQSSDEEYDNMYYHTDEEMHSISVSDDESQVSGSTSSESDDNAFVKEDRLVNGAEKLVKLPTPLDLLHHPFFSEYKKCPSPDSKIVKFEYTMVS